MLSATLWFAVCTDEELLHVQMLLARTEGIFCEPASAIAVAGVLKDLELGKIGAVAREEVLPEVLTQVLKEEAQPADDWKIAQHRVLLLGDIVDHEHDQPADQHDPQYRADAVGHYAQQAVHSTSRDALESPHRPLTI